MGDMNVRQSSSRSDMMNFMHHLLRDIKALEIMLEQRIFESGIHRVGAEQEIALIDSSYRPAPKNIEVLEKLNDPDFTHELSRFNLEVNLPPFEFTGTVFRDMEKLLQQKLQQLSDALKEEQMDYVLSGILPSIRLTDMHLDNLTPVKRYFALNDILNKLRGSDYEFRIEGMDELITKHDSFIFESCNTSFQVHYQVEANEIVDKYNWALAISGPVMSICTNSPYLFGKRLWRETRIALFQQSTDTRTANQLSREEAPRVLLGNGWVEKSIAELFKEDVARYRPLVSAEIEEDSLEKLQNDEVPKLRALNLHNGSIYKWNRVCYGITDGKPHLRIENRYIPAGPTVQDEIANMAFWLGLMHGMPDEYRNLNKKFDFDIVKVNFMKACRMGMGGLFRWVNNEVYSAQDLVTEVLIPIAKDGLDKAGVSKKDSEKYLKIIHERTKTGRSGSQWMIDSVVNMKNRGTKEEKMIAITAGMAKRQKANRPVHRWGLAKIDEAGSWVNRYWRIDQIMTREVYTVNQDDLIDLVPNVMNWQNIRHVIVENEAGTMVGLLTSGTLVSHYSACLMSEKHPTRVKQIMIKNPISIQEDALTKDAISLMRKHKIGCLPVLNKKKELVGIVTEHDFVNVADHFLQEFLKEYDAGGNGDSDRKS